MTLLRFPTFSIPELPSLRLTAQEQDLLNRLESKALRDRTDMYLSEAYYLGEQVIKNLRIAVPKELEFLRTIVGWPALAVDPYVERLAVDGFRLPGGTDVDERLGEVWDLNGLDAEFPLAVTDALSLKCAMWLVGTGDNGPRITVESPLNMAVEWDATGLTATAAVQDFWRDQREHKALLLPNWTVTLAQNDDDEWEVVDRDEHDYGFVPVVRMAHQARTRDRGGRSAITPAIRSTTDSACRDLLDLEVAREIYSVPGITLLGAVEADFQNADGSAKSAWDAYITRVRALQRDDEGNLPGIHQMTVYDPTAFTRLIEMRASQMAAMVAAPPQDLGLYTQGNPASAEALSVAESRRNRRAKLHQNQFGVDLVKVMQYAMRYANGGRLPAEYERMMVDWVPLEEPDPAAMSNAVSLQVAAGVVPPKSDVVRKRLGYNAVERTQLQQDTTVQQGEDAANRIVAAVEGLSGGNGDRNSA